MHLRVARHTAHLDSVIVFYQKVLGLEVLGSFRNHDQYDGVFLGRKNESWHLEFTTSHERPDHRPDEDDLLVFYIPTKEEYDNLLSRIRDMDVQEVDPKNPYWRENGITILDPDGFRIVISVRKT